MKTYLIILLSLSFSGCSLLNSYNNNLPQWLDQQVKEKKYNSALNTIDYIKPDHKDYAVIQNKKKFIIKKMNAYESMAIDKSTQLARQGEWVKALKLLENAANNVVDNKKINKQYKNILNQRQTVIEAYEKDILYRQAKELSNKATLYKKIKKIVSKKERNQLNISKFDDSREETSLRLAALSEKQFQRKEYNNSLKSINLALKLNPNIDTIERLKKIQTQLKDATRRQKASQLKEAKNLLGKLSQGYSHAILSKTKKTLMWLNDNPEILEANPKLANKLKKHLTKGLKQRFQAASKLYSKGKTQEALSIWLKLKELEPDNAKLQSHIERAEKVLNKLEELSNKPKALKK